ncbi:MAG: hypothetical protein AB7V43_19630 [Acidimicrobiia bacterium]
MSSASLHPSDLVHQWHPGARVMTHTNALAELSAANAVAWFDDERAAAKAIADLRASEGTPAFAVVVFRPAPSVSVAAQLDQLLTLLAAPPVRRQFVALSMVWALAFGIVETISFDGTHAVAVASTVCLLLGAVAAVPLAVAWQRRRSSPIPSETVWSLPRRLTMIIVLADDREAAYSALERWWNSATMSAVVDERGQPC